MPVESADGEPPALTSECAYDAYLPLAVLPFDSPSSLPSKAVTSVTGRHTAFGSGRRCGCRPGVRKKGQQTQIERHVRVPAILLTSCFVLRILAPQTTHKLVTCFVWLLLVVVVDALIPIDCSVWKRVRGLSGDQVLALGQHTQIKDRCLRSCQQKERGNNRLLMLVVHLWSSGGAKRMDGDVSQRRRHKFHHRLTDNCILHQLQWVRQSFFFFFAKPAAFPLILLPVISCLITDPHNYVS